jgi:GntR family transcriptional regulator / MocR family aminotransferase
VTARTVIRERQREGRRSGSVAYADGAAAGAATLLGDLLVLLDRDSPIPLHRQLYEGLRSAILSGRLKPGARLPSTRQLAADLNVSRNTVMEAFTQLVAEGYLTSAMGSGTRVSTTLPDHLLTARPEAARRADPPAAPRLSQRGQLIAGVPPVPTTSWRRPVAFYPGIPAYELFPSTIWRRLLVRRWADGVDRTLLDYGDPGGYAPLREAIADYVRTSRRVSCDADQVIVVGGSQQGLDLAARVLLDPGASVWAEDPGYPGARSVLTVAGARIVPVPVDVDGIDVDEGLRRCGDPRLIYVTPSHQFPLGYTMSLPRRLRLLDLAATAEAWIIEDDYDAEFRYNDRPLPALQGLDDVGRVIYAGTFSKSLFPSLRLGYLVVPRALVDVFLTARALTDRHRPTLDQAVLADFLADGHFLRHLRRLRAAYAQRREVLLEALDRHLHGAIRVGSHQAGTHLIAWLPDGVSDSRIADLAAEDGMSAPPLSHWAIDRTDMNALVLGYTGFSVPSIRYRAKRLAELVTAEAG